MGRKDKRARTRSSGDVLAQITGRDIAMLRLIDKHRLVNGQQLWAALAGNAHPRAFAYRLATLFHAGVLDRPPAQFRGGQPARPYVYAVGPRGRQELDRLDSIARTGKRDIHAENKRLKLHFIEHETAVTEVTLAFQLATERQGWTCEFALDDEIPAATGLPPVVNITFMDDVKEPVPLRPDAHVVIDAGEGARRAYFFEVDLGTEPQIRWNLRTSSILRKTIAYWQLSFWHPRPVDGVIFLTTTPQRLANMIDVVRRVDPKSKGSHFFHFALLDQCRIENHSGIFYEPLFRSAKIRYDNPRPLFLDTCPKCNQLIDTANEPHEILNAEPRLELAPATPPLPAVLPDDESVYAHTNCPGTTNCTNNNPTKEENAA